MQYILHTSDGLFYYGLQRVATVLTSVLKLSQRPSYSRRAAHQFKARDLGNRPSIADPCFSQGIRYKDGDYQLKQGAGTARPVQVCLCAARHHSFFVDMCREIGLNRASAPLGRAAKGALWFCPFVRERVQERHGNVLVVLFSNHRYEEANGQWKHLTTHFRQKGTTH